MRVDKLYREFKHKHSKDALLDEQAAAQLFRNAWFNLSHQIKGMSAHSVINTLRVLSSSHFRPEESVHAHLPYMEAVVMRQYQQLLALDIALVVASFLRLHHVPRNIIAELNKLPVFSMLNKQGCLLLLEALANAEFKDSFEVYEKLVSQFRKQSPSLSPAHCVQALRVALRLVSLFPEHPQHELAAFVVERFNSAMKYPDQTVKMENLLEIRDVVEQVSKEIQTVQFRALDMHEFEKNYLRLQVDKIETANPDTIVKVYTTFREQRDQRVYVEALVQKLRENKVDVRKFKFHNFVRLIAMIDAHK